MVELAELDEKDRQEMLETMGLKEPALATLAREAYRLLGLHSFLTAGPKEIRAWEIPVGMSAYDAAGKIHTDIQKGFIRVEIIGYDDFVAAGGETQAKHANKMRVETKSYVMQDYDLANFRFKK